MYFGASFGRIAFYGRYRYAELKETGLLLEVKDNSKLGYKNRNYQKTAVQKTGDL